MLLYLQLGLTGAITGSLYALLALGIVLVFRTLRVLNLAHGAIATLCVYLFMQLTTGHTLGYLPAFAVAVLAGGLIGAGIDRGVMARIADRSLLAKIIATLGVLVVIQSAVGLGWGFDVRSVETRLPIGSVAIGNLHITYEQIIVACISVTIGLALWWMLKKTYLGLAMKAISQSVETSQLLGIAVNRVSTLTWAIGAALAAVAGVLLAPLITLEPVRLTAFMPKALAAALVGRLVSLPGAFAGGIVLGMLENYVPLWVNVPGAADAVAFGVIVAMLVVQRPGLALREQEARIS